MQFEINAICELLSLIFFCSLFSILSRQYLKCQTYTAVCVGTTALWGMLGLISMLPRCCHIFTIVTIFITAVYLFKRKMSSSSMYLSIDFVLMPALLTFLAFTFFRIIIDPINSYSGGIWGGDWLEHYQRSLYWMGKWPHDKPFFILEPLGSRPPLQNMVTAFLMSFFSDQIRFEFYSFQIVTLILSCLIMFPLFGIFQVFQVKFNSRISPLLFMIILIAAPTFFQNLIYPWTKQGCNMLLLAAFGLYFEMLRTRRGILEFLVQLTLALAMCVHYSAVIYALVFQIILLISHKNSSRSHLTYLLLGMSPFVAWLSWIASFRGFGETFLSNTVYRDSSPEFHVIAFDALSNLIATLLPIPIGLIKYGEVSSLHVASHLISYRDSIFLITQHLFPYSMGVVGLIGVMSVLLNTRNIMTKTQTFALATLLILGATIHGGSCRYGIAHIQLQPLSLLALLYGIFQVSSLKNHVLRNIVFGTHIFSGTILFALSHCFVQYQPFPGSAADMKIDNALIFLSDLPHHGVCMLYISAILIGLFFIFKAEDCIFRDIKLIAK